MKIRKLLQDSVLRLFNSKQYEKIFRSEPARNRIKYHRCILSVWRLIICAVRHYIQLHLVSPAPQRGTKRTSIVSNETDQSTDSILQKLHSNVVYTLVISSQIMGIPGQLGGVKEYSTIGYAHTPLKCCVLPNFTGDVLLFEKSIGSTFVDYLARWRWTVKPN